MLHSEDTSRPTVDSSETPEGGDDVLYKLACVLVVSDPFGWSATGLWLGAPCCWWWCAKFNGLGVPLDAEVELDIRRRACIEWSLVSRRLWLASPMYGLRLEAMGDKLLLKFIPYRYCGSAWKQKKKKKRVKTKAQLPLNQLALSWEAERCAGLPLGLEVRVDFLCLWSLLLVSYDTCLYDILIHISLFQKANWRLDAYFGSMLSGGGQPGASCLIRLTVRISLSREE